MMDLQAGADLAKKPNILWIITDDQRADSLACFNQAVRGKAESELGYVSSPQVDRLAQEGVLFTRAYCNAPACAPSRGSMLTGRYPFRSGIYGFEQTHNASAHFKPVLPEIMRGEGYRTALFGKSGYYIFKWGPGLTWVDPGFWDFEVDAKNDLQKHGLTDFYQFTRGGKVAGKATKVGEVRWYYPDGTMKSYLAGDAEGEGGAAPKGRDQKSQGGKPAIPESDRAMQAQIDKELGILRFSGQRTEIIGGQSPQTPEKTLDGWTVAEFTRYLSNAGRDYETAYGLKTSGAPNDRPVFVSLGFHFPHTPVLPPKEFREAFQSHRYQVPDFSLDELKALPKQLQVLHERMRFDNFSPEQKQQAIRDYYAFCAYGDSLIGRSVEAFKDFSKAQGREYLIIYVCGDHGWHLGEQGIEAKFAPYERSNLGAVVVVSSDPKKFPPGTVRRDFIEYVDLAPTIYTAAGLDVSQADFAHLDGQPLQRLIQGDATPRDYVLGEMNHVYGPRAYLRSETFAFSMRTRPTNSRPGKGVAPNADIRWALDAPRTEVEMALFDLRTDSKEQHNLADHPRYQSLADFFRNKLGSIVLGDGRVEVDWSQKSEYRVSDFARGADTKRLSIPAELVPPVQQ
jgi:arylsulfatase A-like enzyme